MEKNILGNKEEAKSSTPLFSDSFGINATMHRLGPPTVGKTRPQKVVLKDTNKVLLVIKSTKKLKDSPRTTDISIGLCGTRMQVKYQIKQELANTNDSNLKITHAVFVSKIFKATV